jgi:hypothetical protein
MEAIERGESEAKLLKRFPPGMVRRLLKLQQAAEDPESAYFLQAQRLIYAITIAPVRKEDKEAEAREVETIEVIHGRLEVPLPGAPGDVPPAAQEG